MRIAKFNEKVIDSVITLDDELVIRDIFQDLDDEWNLSDIKPSLHGGKKSNVFINYLFFGPDFKPTSDRSDNTMYFPSNGRYYNPDLCSIIEILNYNSHFHMDVTRDYLGIYFDLSGPNDFYTTRSKFLDDVEIMSNKIQDITYFKCVTRIGRYNTNQLILFITK